LGFLSFFFWVFISIFISGYSQFFSLLPEGAQERKKLAISAYKNGYKNPEEKR
jgi:hypothetical protein